MECLVWNTLHAKTRYKIPKIFDSSQKLISPIFTAQKVPYAKAELKNISHFWEWTEEKIQNFQMKRSYYCP